MSKKNKSIEVDITETKNHKGNDTEYDVTVKNKTIGTIRKKESDKMVTVIMSSGKERVVSDVDEGVQAVIAEYNLHDL